MKAKTLFAKTMARHANMANFVYIQVKKKYRPKMI